MLAWPFQKSDERYLCMADCFRFKDVSDIKKSFSNIMLLQKEDKREFLIHGKKQKYKLKIYIAQNLNPFLIRVKPKNILKNLMI